MVRVNEVYVTEVCVTARQMVCVTKVYMTEVCDRIVLQGFVTRNETGMKHAL